MLTKLLITKSKSYLYTSVQFKICLSNTAVVESKLVNTPFHKIKRWSMIQICMAIMDSHDSKDIT